MNRVKRIQRPCYVHLLLLLAGFLLPVSAQSQQLDSLIVKAKGHGMISSEVDKQKITSVLVVLRNNESVLVTVTADCQVLAEGTWKASASSPEEILLNITGGAVKGEVIGSGKLLLSSDRNSIKELTINLDSSAGEIFVTFVADDPEPSGEGILNASASVSVVGI